MSDVPPPQPEETTPVGRPPVANEPTSDDKLWALLAHLSGIVIPIIGTLVIWLIKKDESEFIEDQGREALNFQLSVLIVATISIVTCVGPIIVQVAAIVFCIIAALDANNGVKYRYPYTIRMIK